MKVAVIGAGIIGVTTAYELAADGHDVVVFEQRGSVAAEGSFAHGGLISASELAPWVLPSALSRRFGSREPMPWRPAPERRRMAWIGRSERAARTVVHEVQRAHILRLASFSRDRLHGLSRSLRLDFERADGHLILMRSAEDLAQAEPGLAMLAQLGTRFEQLDGARCRGIEPGLSADTKLHAGLYFPDDEVGNCRQFAHLLRGAAQRHGVRFRFHTEVLELRAGTTLQVVHRASPPETTASSIDTTASDRTTSDARDTEPMAFATITENFQSVVVCAALGAPALLAAHGLRLPWQAVHGHSITAPLRTNEMFPDQGPRAAVMDAHHRVSISRLGHRVRVTGSAELGGSAEEPKDRAFDKLFKVLHDWFPGAARMSHVQRWKGTQLMLPDGPPVLGASGIGGVWLNLGHGANGWALACGSARLLADAVGGRAPSIDAEGLGLERLRR